MTTTQTNRTTKTALRFAIAALAVLLLCGAAFAGAAGAVDISNAAEWNAFANSANEGDTTNKSAPITITQSFSFSGVTPTILGNFSNPYSGTVDGGNHVISDFVINGGSGTFDYTGLIGYYKGTCIKNLTISNFSVSGGSDVGGLVGCADSACSFENLKAEFGNVTSGTMNSGGLVGYAHSASFSGCSAADCYISGDESIGSLVGCANSASFSGCSAADCYISGDENIGSLVGRSYSKRLSYFMSGCTVTNCIVSSDHYNVGGLAGLVGAGGSEIVYDITGCDVVNSTVAGDGDVGGLVGAVSVSFSGCKLTSSAVCGYKPNSTYGKYVALAVGNAGGTVIGLGSDVTDDGLTNYLNNETIRKPEITPCDTTRTEAPAGQTLITRLSGIGFKNTPYSAISYVNVTPVYLVSVPPSPSGTVEADQSSAKEGDTVSISAAPNAGQCFVRWIVTMTSSGLPVEVDDEEVTPTAFMMPAAAVTVTAQFSKEDNVVGFLIDTDNLSNVWPASDPKLYWTTDDSAIKIPVGVKKTSGGQYLYTYNFTLVGNLTEKVTEKISGPTTSTFTSSWTAGQIIYNGWHVALYGDALSGDKVDISKNVSILNISIPANTLEKEHYYNLSIPHGELGVTSSADISSPGQIELSTGDSVYFPSGDKKFIFYVRNATEDIPNTTAYEPYDAPDNYPTLASGNPGETFYYFTERLDGQEKRVYLTAVTDPAYDNLFDTNNWTISDITGVSMFNGSIAESVTADSDGKLKNSVVVNGTALGTAKITLTLNKGKGVLENITCFTFSAEPWKKSFVTNDNPVRAAGYASDSLNWSFATPLIYNYTVSAGPVTTTGNGWNTHVKFGNETYGNATSGTAVPVVWNGMVSYNVTGTFGLKNETGKITSNTNFTVVQNTIADGTQRVLVTLTGYKLGDANIDDKVNIADSAVVGITVLKGDSSAAGLSFLPYENRLYADCDSSRSGTIDVADILAINRFIVGLDPWAAA